MQFLNVKASEETKAYRLWLMSFAKRGPSVLSLSPNLSPQTQWEEKIDMCQGSNSSGAQEEGEK